MLLVIVFEIEVAVGSIVEVAVRYIVEVAEVDVADQFKYYTSLFMFSTNSVPVDKTNVVACVAGSSATTVVT